MMEVETVSWSFHDDLIKKTAQDFKNIQEWVLMTHGTLILIWNHEDVNMTLNNSQEQESNWCNWELKKRRKLDREVQCCSHANLFKWLGSFAPHDES